ncbi:6,7-dimethyl-8-ribityllumazine synthase [Gilliamella sp. Choc4-2]|jgi:6,7-dimethyl-8-ribityllumazine synthase|uniref:6,7-dimethyl-8-ribityllumazine synthase n=1 Tax=unclassified Gilliamella TaxID=2685620 RepID=UPI0004DCEE4D|nr:6,7-dimethyl-8-ribityllumazine synthase [Gilliamella apicola]OCG30389.1 6,7-dimethyl-8-ribityllumazine synthase [Gilliamella apicola]OCG47329.1 6,7-dimethyl-8-ribityllumazine synthase [Gilliamella apicola]OCG55443.1 6,7-dimethyl-8-ribityllumazine synthase [Gilliamella apicola]OCG63057.1 6,7-dimethyl-8-ribityllumazine synthase [Gilliamella apicola]
MQTIEGKVSAPKAKVAIIVARFNHFINENLVNGAIDALTRIGQVENKNITVIWVPGAYEIPLTAKVAAQSKKYDAIVALGTVIRGSTAHFDFVAGESSSGLLSASLDYTIPVGFGILTTESIEQAIERAGTKAGNKGSEAALTALEMLNIIKAIKE